MTHGIRMLLKITLMVFLSLIRYFCRVKRDFNGFCVPCCAGTYLFIHRFLHVPSRITRYGIKNAGYVAKRFLNAPKATGSKDRLLSLHVTKYTRYEVLYRRRTPPPHSAFVALRGGGHRTIVAYGYYPSPTG